MDDKEREKVEAAAKEFWFRTGGHPYGEHIMPDSFARQVAAFHLAETGKLRRQLEKQEKVKEYYRKGFEHYHSLYMFICFLILIWIAVLSLQVSVISLQDKVETCVQKESK